MKWGDSLKLVGVKLGVQYSERKTEKARYECQSPFGESDGSWQRREDGFVDFPVLLDSELVESSGKVLNALIRQMDGIGEIQRFQVTRKVLNVGIRNVA